ncbi:MAG: class I SAM-dependent methyltransferase [Candidatus Micrarchaeia archaeon]|jgi:ubiquinone/menaquinone biosynthesis C-methylase UbiE
MALKHKQKATRQTPKEKLLKKVHKTGEKKKTRAVHPDSEYAYDQICESWNENRQRPFLPVAFFVEEFQKRFPRSVGTLSHAKILDAGCGNARNAIWLCEKFPNAGVFCCDISQGMLKEASKNIVAACKGHSCILSKSPVERLAYPAKEFDAVLSTAVLHHLPSRQSRANAMLEMFRVLKDDGFAFVTVWSNPKEKPGSDRNVEFPSKNGKKIKRFYHFFSRRELEGFAKKSGFEIAEIFLEAGGKKASLENKSKARNLCMVLQKPSGKIIRNLQAGRIQ